MHKSEILKHIVTKRNIFNQRSVPDQVLTDAYDIIVELNSALHRNPTERELAKMIEEMSENWMSGSLT
ncbi:MAG TPA: hypothetical protein EYP92_01265 [Candidatus Thioglobus sp.]|jgi:histidinol phosphatase-like PHP family hydrolase|nr:hypothetical protein [Candidatus Thioglobus sp.]